MECPRVNGVLSYVSPAPGPLTFSPPLPPSHQVRAGLPPGVDGWKVSLDGMMGMVVLGGLIISAIYWAMQRFVVPQIKVRGPCEMGGKGGGGGIVLF